MSGPGGRCPTCGQSYPTASGDERCFTCGLDNEPIRLADLKVREKRVLEAARDGRLRIHDDGHVRMRGRREFTPQRGQVGQFAISVGEQIRSLTAYGLVEADETACEVRATAAGLRLLEAT